MAHDVPNPSTGVGNLADMRNELLERLGVTAAAWSADGGHFGFVARLEDAPARGSYVRLRLPDATLLLGQIHRREVAQTALAHFDVDGGPTMAAASVPVAIRHAEGDGIVLGRIEGRRLLDNVSTKQIAGYLRLVETLDSKAEPKTKTTREAK